MANGEAEEVTGGGTDGFGVVGRGAFSDEDAGSSEGSGVADDGAKVAGVSNFGKDDEGSFFEGREGWVFWFTGDGEVAAMKVEPEELGGFFAGDVGADVNFLFNGCLLYTSPSPRD